MPAVANPITFERSSRNYGYTPPARIGFDDLPYLQTRGKGKGVPTYKVMGGSNKPFRPGVGLGPGAGTTIVSSASPIRYNPNTRSGSFDVADGDIGPISTSDMLKNAAIGGLAYGGIGSLSEKLLGVNLTGQYLGEGLLGQVPWVGQWLKDIGYKLNPSFTTAGIRGGLPAQIGHGAGETWDFLKDNTYIGQPGQGSLWTGEGPFSGPIGSALGSVGKAAQGVGNVMAKTINQTSSFPGPIGANPMHVYRAADGSLQSTSALGFKNIWNKINPINKWDFDLTSPVNTATGKPILSNAGGPQAGGIAGFFNNPRSWIPGVTIDPSGVGTGFLGGGVPGQGITSIGNVLGTVGGIFSLADFIDDPSLASGLGTLAGAGASGIGAFSGLAGAAPWLAGAALVASLLMNKKPSNKTGYTSIDLDEFKPLSFGMQGKKYSKENVDQTMQIMEPIIPLIQQLEQQYGVDLKGDIQINYGGRDGLAYNIGNRDVTGFLNRLDYFDGSDQSTRDGGSIFRKTFKGENAGKDFYKSLLGDLETLARQKQAQGGGIIDLANYRGVQQQTPQGAFSYGLPGNVTANIAGGSPVTTGGSPAPTTPRPNTGPEGVFSWGYGNAGT